MSKNKKNIFAKKNTSNNKSKVNKTLLTNPTTAQETLPYKRVYTNGIIEIEEGVYCKSYEVTDIDFEAASEEKQDEIFNNFCDFLNSFNSNTQLQISFLNMSVDKEKFEKNIYIEEQSDDYDWARKEFNDMLAKQLTTEQNGIDKKKYYTVISHATNIDEASNMFSKLDNALSANIRKITETNTEPMTLNERISVLYDICHINHPNRHLNDSDYFQGHKVKTFDYKLINKRGLTTKDIICPNGFDFKKMDKFRMDDMYCRSMYLHALPTYLSTDFISELTSLPYNMLTSVFIEPCAQDKALKLVKKHSLNIRSNIADAQKKAAKDNISADLISPDLLESQEEAEKLRRSLTQNNQKMFFVTLSLTLFANSEEELDKITSAVSNTAEKFLCDIRIARAMQEHAFCSSLPLGHCKIYTDQMLLTEDVALFQPYSSYEYKDKNSFYYGINQISHSMILYNRETATNYNGLILGKSGGGKSFAAKREMLEAYLRTNDDIIIIDPEREYTYLAEEFGGSVIRISPGSGVYLNPFDMNINYADVENPVTLKADFIASLIELISGKHIGLTPIEKSILNRCIIRLYNEYIQYLTKNGLSVDNSKVPTMGDLYEELMMQEEPEAQNLALTIEMYASGTLDSFQKHTNVDTNNRLIVYDIKDIGSGMKELGLQIALNDAWNRIITNQPKGITTRLYVDEIHLLTQTESSAKLLQSIWKRARKWRGVPTGITQDVDDFVSTQEGRGIINNSEFVMMLAQQKISRERLGELLDLSNAQKKYLTNNGRGSGLIYTGKTIIPFKDEFPEELKLYKIMSTDQKEIDVV